MKEEARKGREGGEKVGERGREERVGEEERAKAV